MWTEAATMRAPETGDGADPGGGGTSDGVGASGGGESAPGGMFDLVGPATDPNAAAGATHPVDAPAKGPEGATGEQKQPAARTRPEWLPEAFWDDGAGEPRLEQLAKSHQDLRRKLGLGQHKAPESAAEYRLPQVEGVPEGLVKPDDPVWQAVAAAAHAAGVPQQTLDAIVAPYLKAAVEAGAQAAPDPAAEQAAQAEALKAELGKLGPQGPQIVRGVGQWLAGLQARGILSEAGLASLRTVSDADGVRALAKLRELAGEPGLGVDLGAQVGGESEAEARRLIREGRTEDGLAMLQRLQNQGLLRSA